VRIAVVADTHNRVPPALLDAIANADEIWHLGDVCAPSVLDVFKALGPPVRIVRGNCDSFPDWPLTRRFELKGFRIHLEHIPPHTAPDGTDLLFHGHTHIPRNEMVRGVRFLNPGCITRPNRGAPASFGWLQLSQGEPLEWQLVSLTTL
jgi:hypothetical protein